MSANCPSCQSSLLKKNGFTYHKKQRLQCKSCSYQFTPNSTKIYINETKREIVRKLLLERLPLAGIMRVTGVGKSWLSKFRLAEYDALPDDLNADTTMPSEEEYQANNLHEAVCNLTG